MISIKPSTAVGEWDALTPHHINAQLAEIASVFHSLDRNNIHINSLDPIKVALDAWGGILFNDRDVSQDTVLDAYDANHQIFRIPNDAGDPWEETLTTGDCVLEIEFSICHEIDTTSGTFPVLWIGVLVDGALVGKSPWQGGSTITASGNDFCRRQGTINTAWPVAAGEHRLAMVFGAHGANTDTSWDCTITWKGGAIWCREARR